MASRSVPLLVPSDPRWVAAVVADLDGFLADHANCERKASVQAMSFVVKFPDRTRILPPLIRLAQEELAHFEQVYALMERRGLTLRPDSKDRYVNPMLEKLRHGRDERFLDRMLLAGVVESRAAERFGLLGDALPDRELAVAYRTFAVGEAGHAELYPSLAAKYFGEDEIRSRLAQLAEIEAEVIGSLEPRATLY